MATEHEKGRVSFLRLVLNETNEVSRELVARQQLALFPEGRDSLLSFFHVSFFSTVSMLKVTSEVNPGLFVDVRAIPAFVSLGLDRSVFLNSLESRGTRYVDVAGSLGSRRVTSGELDFITSYLVSAIEAGHPNGSVFLLFDNFELARRLAEDLPLKLKSSRGGEYESQVFLGGENWHR